ncbi:OmpA/MotB family protein [Haliovirga abyssi]|uniref:Chemotaxis protein MotB n=1 Tax=Haliovirga abyssi TaxID=2996794 RepID=A0AAU9DNZ9_9FUSO|nr:flagellar motor protein MotB [Haliovirga abyssi]BDU50113.1 chemotaxis protein MotB [Haliovirga abyssi]
MGEKKCPECKEGAPEYMNTYGDMMTLLMCFFVLLFAFSSLDSQKFQTMMKAFQGALGVMKGGKTVSPEKLITDSRIQNKGTEMKFAKMAKELQKELQDRLNEENKKTGKNKKLKDIADIKLTERGLKISFGDRALFDIGKAKLKKESKVMLDKIAGYIGRLENNIVVEGHTDNVPIHNNEFPSNWELSTTRATNVLRNLLKKSPSLKGRISASGYGDTRPIATNDTVSGRKKNRRVDIIILKSKDEIVSEELLKRSLQGGK